MRTVLPLIAALALAVPATTALAGGHKIGEIIEKRSDEDKARDQFRHPKETLEFFGLKPDMTVVEALPGGGWYTRIILPYVAKKGKYGAVNYRADMFKKLFPNISEERLEGLRKFPETFPKKATEWVDGEPEITAYVFGSAPESMHGKVDMVLFIRALHNLNRGGPEYMDQAVAEAFKVLKPGGIVGVVQHRAQEDKSDEFASGSAGYLKQSSVVATFEKAGFKLAGSSDVNANAKDRPSDDEIVWRLPPSRRGDKEKRAEYDAIGESDRMTLKFMKPKM